MCVGVVGVRGVKGDKVDCVCVGGGCERGEG